MTHSKLHPGKHYFITEEELLSGQADGGRVPIHGDNEKPPAPRRDGSTLRVGSVDYATKTVTFTALDRLRGHHGRAKKG